MPDEAAPDQASDLAGETFEGWFDGRRVLVVGASSGIGRATAVAAARAGARVALVARRPELLAAAAAEAGGPERAYAVTADVTVEAERQGAIAAATTWLDGLEVLIVAAGRAALGRIDEMTEAGWRELLVTNVIAPALIARDTLPILRKVSTATIALLSTHIVGEPWPWLGAYSASKAALEELAHSLRVEEPDVRVIAARIGDTVTGFADAWDRTLFDAALGSWHADGRFRHEIQRPEDAAARLLSAIADVKGPDELTIRGASTD